MAKTQAGRACEHHRAASGPLGAGDIRERHQPRAAGQSSADISIDRYFSKAWHDREVDNVWRKTWQLACRVVEIPNVGDHVVYEIVRGSLIVVRAGPNEFRA